MESVKDILSKGENKVFVQVGTNVGKDYFNQMVRLFKPELTILIEPNKDLIEEIKKNYEGIDVNIENVAITDKEGEITLYHPCKEGYYHGCFSMYPMNDWGEKENMVTIQAKGVTIDSIFKKYGITEIDYLCVDTEGNDAQILKTIDFKKIQVKLIVFEVWNFQTKEFTRYNENWERLGFAAHNEICGILIRKGFGIYDDPDCNYNRIAINET